MVVPVILAGGKGLRLWPLSRQTYPKPLISLISDQSLLQDTLSRLKPLEESTAPVIICNVDHRHLIEGQLHEAGVDDFTLLLEPQGRNTAPAIAAAALWLEQQDRLDPMLVLSADHSISDEAAFAGAVQTAGAVARCGHLVTFGITPNHPATGYGYLQRGVALDETQQAFKLGAFIEKPDSTRAKTLLEAGDCFWNSGMFMFTAEAIIAEFEHLKPDILQACWAALLESDGTQPVLLDAQAFGSAEAISIDYAIMEQTDKAVMVPCGFGWSDIGDWDAVWEGSQGDGAGNRVSGDVLAHDVKDSLLHSTGPLLVGLGLENMMAIAMEDAVLVAPRARAQDVKSVVEALREKADVRADAHNRIHRPWGYFESLLILEGFQVKQIVIKPGARLSLQKHRHRGEHWVVVKGTAIVTRDDERLTLGVNETIFIPLGAVHRLENPGTQPMHLIEVEIGDYLGEDDIVRFEDDYGRVEESFPDGS